MKTPITTHRVVGAMRSLLMLAGWAAAADLPKETPRTDPLDACNVVWDSPGANASGSMPIGNGDIGMNVWVEPNGGMRFPAIWGPNYDWLPDQCHGGNLLNTTRSMLLQSEGRKIYLFPAWPKEWHVSFKLHAPLNTTVEGELRDGKVTALKVTPQSRAGDVINMLGLSAHAFHSGTNLEPRMLRS